MKLPHVTIEYREEESLAVGKMSFELVVGFGLHWAWVYSVMYNNHALFFLEGGSYQTPFFLVSLVMFIVTLLLYGVLLKPVRKLFKTPYQRKRNRLVAAVLMSVSVLLLLLGSALPPLTGACCVASGVFSGFGSAIMFMSFGVSFSICDVATASVSTALALVVASVAHGLLMMLEQVASPAGGVACALIPFVELWCLFRCSRQLTDNLEFQMLSIPVRTVSFGLRMGVSSGVMGVVLGVVRAQALSVGARLPAASDFALVIALASVMACLVVILAMLMQRQTTYFMFRTLLPVVALLLGVMLTPLGNDNPSFFVFVMFATYLMLEACLWIAIADISQRYRISAFTVFGFGRGGMAVGTLLAAGAMRGDTATSAVLGSLEYLVIVVLILLIVGYMLFPTRREILSMLDWEGACSPLVEGRYDPVSLQMRTTQEATCTEGVDVEPKPEGDGPNAGDGADVADAAVAEHTRAQEGGHAGEGQPPAPSEQSGQGGEREPLGAPDAAPPHGVPAGEGGQRDGDQHGERVGPYKRKCLMVANTYLLSRRETEILFLLAKGHNSAAIQKALYISAGTANTHMRNIYRKLSVHSQQELIAMVEAVAEQREEPAGAGARKTP